MLKNLFNLQAKFNSSLYNLNEKKLSDSEIVDITKTLSLCLHSEVSELMQSVDFKDHHAQTDFVDKTKMLYESVDIFRYILAILNINQISSENFIEAFYDKDSYLNFLHKTQDNWDGSQPVVIVDMDDVLTEFRQGFADWLGENYNLEIDVYSKEYYFITALNKLDLNPEAVFYEFVNKGGFRNLDVVDGSIEMLDNLKKQGYWIQLLTARPKENLKCFYDTFYWLKNNSISFDAVDFSTEKFRWCARSKYYDKDKIVAAIDDAPKHIVDYAKHGIVCYYPRKNYNLEVDGRDNTFVYTNPSKLIIK
tara:strand:- start:2708 stop:3628 length:921 start_codon:yes stop_codon:yes gene_type:complete